jgi:hypothetical protein
MAQAAVLLQRRRWELMIPYIPSMSCISHTCAPAEDAGFIIGILSIVRTCALSRDQNNKAPNWAANSPQSLHTLLHVPLLDSQIWRIE